MLLTDDERRRFAEYLEKDADSNELLAAQLEKLNSQLGMQKRIEAAAERLIARNLRVSESQSIR
jgi:hypothetical protein